MINKNFQIECKTIMKSESFKFCETIQQCIKLKSLECRNMSWETAFLACRFGAHIPRIPQIHTWQLLTFHSQKNHFLTFITFTHNLYFVFISAFKKMLNIIRTGKFTGTLLAIVSPFHFTDHDIVPQHSKTAASFADRRPDTETGKDRLYAMFSVE